MIHCGIQRQVLFQLQSQLFFKQLREKGILTGIASGRGIFGVVPEIRELKPDFFVTLNGAYIEDKKGQVIYQHQIEKSDVEEYISWAKQEGIEYGWLGVMMPSCRLVPI